MSERGTVRRWVEERGFGFIAPDDGSAEIFVHRTAIRGSSVRPSLIEGQRVRFTVVRGPKGLQAHAVEPL